MAGWAAGRTLVNSKNEVFFCDFLGGSLIFPWAFMRVFFFWATLYEARAWKAARYPEAWPRRHQPTLEKEHEDRAKGEGI